METCFSKYQFLAQLGLKEKNLGALYDGEWHGSGEVLESHNPSTEEVIATTTGASVQDYEKAITAM